MHKIIALIVLVTSITGCAEIAERLSDHTPPPEDPAVTESNRKLKAQNEAAEEAREAAAEEQKAAAEEADARNIASAEALQKKFKIDFCENPGLLEVEFYGNPIEKNCIYGLANGQMGAQVLQSIPGGIIVAVANGAKAIFIRTKQKYADGDMLRPQYVRSIGLMKFKTVLGAQRTIHSFQYLADAEEGSALEND